MKRMKVLLAVALACLTTVSCAAAKDNTYIVTQEEYALLQKYKRLEEIMEAVDRAYLWEYDKGALLDGAAQGMLGALGDPYAYYATPEKMGDEQEMITGEYVGLGFEVFPNAVDNTITIRRVFHGGPAQKAGILPGDKILSVNGEEMTAYDLNKAVSIMRGEVGGEVTLVIWRETEAFEVTCVRAVVQTETLECELLEKDIGYIRLYQFEGGATQQFGEAIGSLREQGARSLVLDLRGNPGGLLNLAVEIANYFIDDQLVVSTKDKYGRTLSFYAEEGAWEVPVVVLMNQHTASASEILAMALKDYDVAKTVGTKSYGKGIAQTMIPFFPDGAGVQFTTDYWLSPKGECIHEIGVTPDYEVELAEDVMDENFDYIREKDNQLQKAVEIIREMLAGVDEDAA